MNRSSMLRHQALEKTARQLASTDCNLTIIAPGIAPIRIGPRPDSTTVRFRIEEALEPLRTRDHLALAEAFLDGTIDVEGDFIEAMRITEIIAPDPTWRERLLFAARLLIRDRRMLNRESISFHYDLEPEFYLPWLDRWRSYSHGFYASADDTLEEAQARKLRYAIDALDLKPGMDVFDMGGGWGSFLEFAGKLGIRVHAITISEQQHQFVTQLIESEGLPCRIELVDFLDFEPPRKFDAAVFMGTFEHFGDYVWAARFLRKNLKPDGRLYADFCAHDKVQQVGAFLAKYIWPGTANYVDPKKLTAALSRENFSIGELHCDTPSYAMTVRDWSDSLERVRQPLADKWGERQLRAFLLYLRASQFYFEQNKVQAYHLVASRRATVPA